MAIIQQTVISDMNLKVLLIDTVKHHYHVVVLHQDQRFHSASGKNVRWRVGSFVDTGVPIEVRYAESYRLYRETVSDYRKDTRARKARQLASA